jgi:hypothetical protein
MSLTPPAAFMFVNAADTTATIAVPGSLALTPPSRLQNQHTSVRCRVEATSMAITVALAAATTIDTFGLFGIQSRTSGGVDVTSSAVTQIRASLADTTAVDGAAYNSGSAAGRVSSYYGNLVALRDGSVSARYVLFNISVAGAAYIEAGFVMIGLRNQVGYNAAFGASDTPVDPSIVTTSRSGADWIDVRNQYREWDFSFEILSETERFGWVEDLDQLIGARTNVMVVRNCASMNLGRDTLCGRITGGAPVVSREAYTSSDGLPAYSKSYRIKQRL